MSESRLPAVERNVLLSIAAALLAFAACSHEGPPVPAAPGQPAGQLTIMTFNVENLFDNEDDPGKDDRTFLPLEAKRTDEHRAACERIEVAHWREQCLEWDWSEEILDRKLTVVAEAILQVDGGRGPDIVALQEVENLRILERLRTEYLADAGYRRGILIEGDDARGIDVAFLAKLPLAEAPALHRIPFGEAAGARVADTRGILEATFRLPDGALLTGYAVHFPAPFHPTAMREAAFRHLNELKAALPADRPVFAAGDFNVTSAEDTREALLDRHARPHWTVIHDRCAGCRGTSYYARDDSWSFLDMILWSPAGRSAGATWEPVADSVALANRTPAQVTARGTPARFELPEGKGVSDHWPLVFSIALQ